MQDAGNETQVEARYGFPLCAALKIITLAPGRLWSANFGFTSSLQIFRWQLSQGHVPIFWLLGCCLWFFFFFTSFFDIHSANVAVFFLLAAASPRTITVCHLFDVSRVGILVDILHYQVCQLQD